MGAGWMQCPGPSACSPASQDARKKDWACEGGEGQGGASVMETSCSLCPGGAAGGPEEREGNAAGAHLGRVRFSTGVRPHTGCETPAGRM